MKTAKPSPRQYQVTDELLGKIITSLIQFKLTKESKHYLDTIDLLDELVLETTGPQDDILGSWESALMGVVFDENGDSVPCYSSARVVEQYLAEGFSKRGSSISAFFCQRRSQDDVDTPNDISRHRTTRRRSKPQTGLVAHRFSLHVVAFQRQCGKLPR